MNIILALTYKPTIILLLEKKHATSICHTVFDLRLLCSRAQHRADVVSRECFETEAARSSRARLDKCGNLRLHTASVVATQTLAMVWRELAKQDVGHWCVFTSVCVNSGMCDSMSACKFP